MLRAVQSAYIWIVISFLMLIWLPLLAVIRIFDRDPAHYHTGRWFRRLGAVMTRVNPFWTIDVSGAMPENPRNPYVVVCNHQSMADIPVVSLLPWDMKWVGKAEVFRLPVAGWMMKLAGDIPIERGNTRSGAHALIRARHFLERKCSVMFFPEGTRTPDGRVRRFNEGAFGLAIKEGVPVLVLALDGTIDALPKKSWKFGGRSAMKLKVLGPVEPERGESARDLTARVRSMIIDQVAEWRGGDANSIDAARGGVTPATRQTAGSLDDA